MFFSFYLLVPILPLYLIEVFNSSKLLVGFVLSSYTLAALLIRPFAGFVLDMLYRRPIYLLAYFLFVISFIGYPLANLIHVFLLVRILHGITYGFVTTAGNSFIVDIMPASRRGEGLGYFGISNTLSMAVGPMASLYMHGMYSYNAIFYTAIASGLLGFFFAMRIKPANRPERSIKQPLAFDRFFLTKGFNGGVCLMLLGIPYGMLVTYVAIYGKELGIRSGVGVFFSLMSLGLVASRLFAGKQVDRGKLVQVIGAGTIVCLANMLALAALKRMNPACDLLVMFSFYAVSLFLGLGYGMLFPAYNTLFVNLAPHNRRATASSTYMTSWDIGIGVGLVTGGWLADSPGGLPLAYLVGGFSAAFSYLVFRRIAGPHYEKHKLY